MIVCHCRVVSDRAIDEACCDGAATLGAVCRATGAAQDCGTCIFAVKSIVRRHRTAEELLRLALDREKVAMAELDRAVGS